jgi:hypothetical protein
MTPWLGCKAHTGCGCSRVLLALLALQFDLNALQNGTGVMDDSDDNSNQPNNIL